jgi:DNA-binding YbaB/EbfC family protein
MAKGFNRMPGSKKAPGASGGMMQQLKAMQEQMELAQQKLAEETVEATVGGGAVKVTMTGDQVCKSVTIDPELLKDADAEMLQDMMLSAINLGLEKSRQLQQEKMGPLAGGLSGLGF